MGSEQAVREWAGDLEEAGWDTFEQRNTEWERVRAAERIWGRSCWFVGRKVGLEAKQLFAWGKLSRYDYCELLVSHFHTVLLSFSTAFLSIDLLIGVDIKGHSFPSLDLTLYTHAPFWLCFGIFDFSCKYLMHWGALPGASTVDFLFIFFITSHFNMKWGFHLMNLLSIILDHTLFWDISFLCI